MHLTQTAIAMVIASATSTAAFAQVVPAGRLAYWTFDSLAGDSNPSTGTLQPAYGQGTFSIIGGTGTFGVGVTGGGDDSAARISDFPAQGTGSGTTGFSVRLNPGPSRWVYFKQWRQVSDPQSPQSSRVDWSADGVSWQTLAYASFSTGNGVFRTGYESYGVPVGLNPTPVWLRVVAATGAGGVYHAASGQTYNPAAAWRIDEVEVWERSYQPYAWDVSRTAQAGDAAIVIPVDNLGGDQDDGDDVTLSLSGDTEHFSVTPEGIAFTPPAAGSMNEPHHRFACLFTLTDRTGLTASATMSVDTFSDTDCTMSVWPERVDLTCPDLQVHDVLLVASPPQGSGGTIQYRWSDDAAPGIVMASEQTFRPHRPGSFRCTAWREGGTVGCGGNGSVPAVSNAATVTYLFGTADMGTSGGTPTPDRNFDNNDLVVFIDLFFQQDHRADLGSQGGVMGSDGLFNNNDFVVFVDRFFAHC
jgi:hypothetical protein